MMPTTDKKILIAEGSQIGYNLLRDVEANKAKYTHARSAMARVSKMVSLTRKNIIGNYNADNPGQDEFRKFMYYAIAEKLKRYVYEGNTLSNLEKDKLHGFLKFKLRKLESDIQLRKHK